MKKRPIKTYERTQKTVIIIDKDQASIDMLSEKCRSLGLTVWTATTAIEATVIMDMQLPDLVIVDADLPGRDAKTFLQFLDIKELNWVVPVIVLCGKTSITESYRVQRICAYYVRKSPIELEKLDVFAHELVDIASTRIGGSGNNCTFNPNTREGESQ